MHRPLTDLTPLINATSAALPDILALVRGRIAREHPGAPVPTDEDIKGWLASVVYDSVSRALMPVRCHEDILGAVPAGG